MLKTLQPFDRFACNFDSHHMARCTLSIYSYIELILTQSNFRFEKPVSLKCRA